MFRCFPCFLFFYLITISTTGICKKPLEIIDELKSYSIDSSYFEQVDSIGYLKFMPSVKSNNSLYFINPNTKQSYWYRFTFKNNSSFFKQFLIVSYNYAMDEIDVIIKNKKGEILLQSFRDSIGIYNRKIIHKQPVFEVILQPFESVEVIIRIKDKHSYNYVFAAYTPNQFFSHFFIEYLLFGMFYGLMLFVIAYSTVNAIYFKEKIFLFYIIFIFSQIVHMLFRDGTGLLIIPYHTEYADLIKSLSRCVLVISLLLYTTAFLKIPRRSITFKVVAVLIVLRILYQIFIDYDRLNLTFHMEMFVILFCNGVCLYCYLKGNKESKFMFLGLSILSFAYIIYFISLLGVTSLTSFGFFSFYFAIAAESLFMTIALTERFKTISIDNKIRTQQNNLLEKMVEKRTDTIIEQKNLLEATGKELHNFLYSVSHDLKGPIKTIQGLCNLGFYDKDINHLQIYGLINNKIQALEVNINDLNYVSTLKGNIAIHESIDLNKLYNEVIFKLQELEGYSKIHIEFVNLLDNIIYSDTFSLKIIFANIIENSIKFRNPNRDSFLRITTSFNNNQCTIVFEDNGDGISSESLPSIFNMFYRGHQNAKNDTGLGLYLVKLAIQKLKGEIKVESKLGEGTSICCTFPIGKQKPV